MLTGTVLTGGTTTTTKYYSINGQRLAEKVNGTLTSLVTDLLSNVVMAINASGSVVAVELYEPYGTLNYSWGTMPTSHNYTDQRLDSQSGLVYYNFRWYDPMTGQFVRSDVVQNNTSGMDPFAYVGDNPETRNDPSGQRIVDSDLGGGDNSGVDDQALTQACLASTSCSQALGKYNYDILTEGVKQVLGWGLMGWDFLNAADNPMAGEEGQQQFEEEMQWSAERQVISELSDENLGKGEYDKQMMADFLSGNGVGKSLEGEAGVLLRNEGIQVDAYDKQFYSGGTVPGRNGNPIGQIDIATPNTIFEVKSGDEWNPRYNAQVAKLQTNTTINPEGKTVVVYAPNLSGGALFEARGGCGCTILTSPQELIMYAKLYG